jgi:UDP-glucuronate 4-epimerase
MKYILVTGGAGFIGSNLCEALLKLDYKVINLDNFNDYYNPCYKRINIINAQLNPNYILIQGDIRDNELLDKIFTKYNIDTVVHLAALAGVRKSIENPNECIDIDINGTVNLLEACNKHMVSKMVFASSSSVYGNNKIPFNEGDIVNSQMSPYAAAKAAGELLCRTYNNMYKLPIVCLRFFTVYGPRQRPEMAIHNFIRCVDEGKEIVIYGDGTSTRDYTFVDDIIHGIISAIKIGCDFEIFNLGNSNSITLNYLINLIENKLGKTAIKNYTNLQRGDVFNTFADITKAKRLLNYNPSIPIEKGIDLFVNWYYLYKDLFKINYPK